MDKKTVEQDRFDRRLPFYAATGSLILFLPIVIFGSDIVEMLYLFVAIPSISVISLVVAVRKKGVRLAVLSMLFVYLAISLGLFKNAREVRTITRWFFWSKHYKAEVLAQPDSPNGALRHIEWDGWGFPGAGNTVVYLVFDPSDSLWTAARSRSPGKFNGIPCEVYRVRRLESHYYSILFYTGTDWGHCE
jgi:hypothetical protein